MLFDATSTDAEIQLREVQAAADSVNQQIYTLTIGTDREFDTAFASPVLRQAGALLVAGSPFFTEFGAIKSSHWQHAIRSPQSTNGASSLRRVG